MQNHAFGGIPSILCFDANMVGRNQHEDRQKCDDEIEIDYCESGAQDYCANNSSSWIGKYYPYLKLAELTINRK